MIRQERQITGLLGIVAGFVLLFIVPDLVDNQRQLPPAPIQRQFPLQFCEDVKLSNPGRLSYTMATVCVNEEFEIVINAGHLTDEKYNQLIQPVLDSLRTEAKNAGIEPKLLTGRQ